uniref:Uncharacterized protein n=1 Tax=Guillardia theta TaxID=55529 RepID=A0A7S4HAB9_GUITH|mmetsp:Transcript_11829/g.40768  ORF Transcript_11829/g.40768 Transcript_11829/m.40768 type:complete len:104 (+) Transcript_11829:483-794(+)
MGFWRNSDKIAMQCYWRCRLILFSLSLSLSSTTSKMLCIQWIRLLESSRVSMTTKFPQGMNQVLNRRDNETVNLEVLSSCQGMRGLRVESEQRRKECGGEGGK